MSGINDAVVAETARENDEPIARLGETAQSLEEERAARDRRVAELEKRVRWTAHLQKMEPVRQPVGGMVHEMLPRIFEPHLTTEKNGEGTGLGLTFVRCLVEDQGGRIEVNSEPGRGTRFDISPPAAGDADSSSAPEPFDELRGLTGHGERVLVVEDDEGVREFVVEALEETGYRAVPAADGAEALAILHRERNNPVQAMVIDMMLPDTDGFELADRIRHVWGPVPVVVQTGHSLTSPRRALIQEKGFQLLRKPCTLSQLLSAIRAALRGKKGEG